MDLEPENECILLNYAGLLTISPSRDDIPKIDALYKKALSLNPNNADTYWCYADFLERVMNDRNLAQNFREKAKQIE
jgi:cytochrome c-type biogenesis protein CcmH/NrfG